MKEQLYTDQPSPSASEGEKERGGYISRPSQSGEGSNRTERILSELKEQSCHVQRSCKSETVFVSI